MKAQAEAARELRWFADNRNDWAVDGWAMRNLSIDLRLLAARTDHLNETLAAISARDAAVGAILSSDDGEQKCAPSP